MSKKALSNLVDLLIASLYKKMNNLHIDLDFKKDEDLLKSIDELGLLNKKNNLGHDEEIENLKIFYSKKLKERKKYTNSLTSNYSDDLVTEKYINSHKLISFEVPESKIDFFIQEVNQIQNKFKNKKIIKSVALVDFCNVRYFDLFIVQILALYCQILGINLYFFPLKPSLDYSNFFIKEIEIPGKDFLGKLNSRQIDENFSKTDFDLVVFNNVSSHMYFYLKNPKTYFENKKIKKYLNAIVKNSRKSLFISYFNNVLYDEFLKSKGTFEFSRYDNFSFFSKLISSANFVKEEEKNYEYDIMAGGGIGQRDFGLLKKICELKSDLRVVLVNNALEDLNKLKKMFSPFKNVSFVLNGASYNDYYNYLNKSRIYLNCISKDVEHRGTTGILPVLSSNSAAISYSNDFYEKLINHGEDGFFYGSDEECIDIVFKLLDSSKESEKLLKNIRKNRYIRFLNSESIENLLERFLVL